MSEARELALQLIEHELGRSYRTAEITERVRVEQSFASLKHRPIQTIRLVKARMCEWAHSNVFGHMGFVEIPLLEIECLSTGIILPLTMWGSYDEADVTYEYGYSEIPDGISRAVDILTDAIEQSGGIVSTYAAQLLLHTDEIETLLAPYR